MWNHSVYTNFYWLTTRKACCFVGRETPYGRSVGFYGVPNWDVVFLAWKSLGPCSGSDSARQSYNAGSFACIGTNSGKFGSAIWTFRNRRLGRSLPEQECKKVDTLKLEAGQEYDISGMDDGVLDQLLELAKNGTVAAELPEVFKAFERRE
jgi:hypothetical protein